MKKIQFEISSHLFAHTQNLQPILMTDYMRQGIHHSYEKVLLKRTLTQSQLKEIEENSEYIRTEKVKQLKIFLKSRSLEKSLLRKKVQQKNISKSQVITSVPAPATSRKLDSTRNKKSLVLPSKSKIEQV